MSLVSLPPSPSCITLKVAVIGELGVGKTSLIHRICGGEFNEDEESTIGASYRSVCRDACRIEFWDTAGQERYRSLIGLYLRGVHVIWIVTSVDKKVDAASSFDAPWRKYIERANVTDAVLIHVYSKGDLVHKQETLHPGCIVTSARNSIGLDTLLKVTTERGRDVFDDRLILRDTTTDDFVVVSELNCNKAARVTCVGGRCG